MIDKNKRYETKNKLYALTAHQLGRLAVIFERQHTSKIIEQKKADAIFKSLEQSRESAIGVVMNTPILQEQTPLLLPIIPKNILGVSVQAQLIECNGKIGRCEIDPDEIQDQDFGRVFYRLLLDYRHKER
ncbi:hypothetical protein KJ786_03060 [Patescibacteria group bacterium]|nr:hypothetical protein [Patescibacteria group bacterium]